MAAAVNLGRGHYVVQSSYSVAVRYVATSDVIGNIVYRHGTGGVPCRRDYSTSGDVGHYVHGGDGSVAPPDGSG